VANCSRVLGFTLPGFADLAGLGTSLHESSSDRLSGGILSVPARLWGQKMIFAGSQTAAGQCLIWVRSRRDALKF
jgi:hypothetical protein